MKDQEIAGALDSPPQGAKRWTAVVSRYSKKASDFSAAVLERARTESTIARRKADRVSVSRQRAQRARRIGELVLEHRDLPEVELFFAAVPALVAELDAVRKLEQRLTDHAAEIEALRGKGNETL